MNYKIKNCIKQNIQLVGVFYLHINCLNKLYILGLELINIGYIKVYS